MTETTKKVWLFETQDETKKEQAQKDKKEIIDYFVAQPVFRIMKFMGKYWVQIKKPNVMAEYENLEDCIYYDILVDQYFIKNGFNFLFSAKRAYKLYRKTSVIFEVPKLNLSKDLIQLTDI